MHMNTTYNNIFKILETSYFNNAQSDAIQQSQFFQNINNAQLHLGSIDDKTKFKFHIISLCRQDPNFNKVFHFECSSDTFNTNNICIDINTVNDQLLYELCKNPNYLYQLSSRKFEEVITEIFIRKGYNAELTPITRDGGKDIYVTQKTDLGSFLYIVECKKYKPTQKVGVHVLRDLYGVLSKENATYGIVVTTSYFSQPAQKFQTEVQNRISLQDFDAIKQWLCDVT